MTVKTELIAAIAEKAGQTQAVTRDVFEATFVTIAERLIAGDKVAVTDFGVFTPKEREARVGRNPATGAAVNIPAKKAVSFRMSSKLKGAL